MKAQINAITLMMLSGVASVCATQISFDTAEGYADGALNGQPSRGGYIWNTDFNASGWQVENGAATVNSTINRWVGTRWSEPVSGTAISQSATFSLTRSGESALKGTTLFFWALPTPWNANPSRIAQATLCWPASVNHPGSTNTT